MKRILSLILCGILILGFTGCEQKAKNPFEGRGDFRNASWGMTIDEAKALEATELLAETEEAILYQVQVGKYTDVSMSYLFQRNQLNRGVYLFTEEHKDASLYIEDFDQIKEALSEVYGKPKLDASNWVDEPSGTILEEQLGSMVVKGNLTYYAQWETDQTDIKLGMYGKNGEVTIGLTYTSKEYVELEKSYEADTTGYRSARTYQDYLDHPGSYQDEFIYVTGEIWDLSFEDTILLRDKEGEMWVALMTYGVDNAEILEEGDEITLFGRVAGEFATLNAVSMMLFKVDKEGEVLHVKEPGGKTFEKIFFLWKETQ